MKVLLYVLCCIFFAAKTNAQDCNDPNTILSVKKSRVGNFEYVIFNIRSPFTGNYTIRTVTPSSFDFDEGASPGTTVTGCRYKRIQFTSMNWFCTPQRSSSGAVTTIQQIKNAGQFEGYMTFVIGYRCPAGRYLGIYQYPGTIIYGGATVPVTKVVMKFRH